MSENDQAPPVSVTPEIFQQWRSPRRGSANPDPINNPLWEWLIACRLNAYQANEALNGPSPFDAGPMWCFDRFGQSVTRLPDGRTALIGGEHEDYYDPDFYIYNDLVVMDDGGKIEIYGYPREVFPPTDFHSATIARGEIILVGNLGYPEDRRVEQTQVLVVNLKTWSVSRIDTVERSPGWIHRHDAELRADGACLRITGGQIFRGESASLVENIDDWTLHLDGWRWERLTERRWVRFEVYRENKRPNHLFDLRQVLWAREVGWHDREAQELRLQTELGSPPRLDMLPLLYCPSLPHEALPQNEDQYRIYRIRVDGVVVRYVEESYSVQVTVEGRLPSEVVEHLRQDLTRKLEALEQSPMVCEEIPP